MLNINEFILSLIFRNNFFLLVFLSVIQAQFILCIAHTIRALCTDCGFPSFVSALLLLNASIFFVLFMNFYIQAYRKQPTLEKKIDWTIYDYNVIWFMIFIIIKKN